MGCVCCKPYAVGDSKESLRERLSNKTSSDLQVPRVVSSRREDESRVKESLDNNNSSNNCNGRAVLMDKQVNGSARSHNENFERKTEMAEYISVVQHPGMGMVPRGTEGEQVSAGWPPWLVAVAGEAIRGWVPRRADSFEKLDK
ncbi:probable serine threonine- kinase At1g54610, partial [Olea europaea subsp. europaea]